MYFCYHFQDLIFKNLHIEGLIHYYEVFQNAVFISELLYKLCEIYILWRLYLKKNRRSESLSLKIAD